MFVYEATNISSMLQSCSHVVACCCFKVACCCGVAVPMLHVVEVLLLRC